MKNEQNVQRTYYKDLVMTPRSAEMFAEDAEILKAQNARLIESLRNLTDLCEGRGLFPQAVQNACAILREIAQ